MSTQEVIIWNKSELETWINEFSAQNEVEEPIRIVVKDYKPRRNLKQNSLYWMWMDYLANYFTGNKKIKGKYTKDDMHDICRHLHLGYKDRSYGGKTNIAAQLIETRDLDQGEMFAYMQAVDEWAATSLKVALPRPENSEYDQIKAGQVGG